jgi:molecular chaperone DnaK (HSP70)
VLDIQVSTPAKLEQQSLVALPVETYQRFLEEEGQMTVDDNLEIATAEAKNNLEEYLLALRSHLSDRYADFVKPADRDALVSELNALEDWLYEDGEDEKKSVRPITTHSMLIGDSDFRCPYKPCCAMKVLDEA